MGSPRQRWRQISRCILLLVAGLLPTLAVAAEHTAGANIPSAKTQSGEATFLFQSPHSLTLNETCIVTERLEGAHYSAKDLKAELKLCSYDLYGIKSTNSKSVQVASCPKTSSKTVGIDIYELPTVMPLQAFRGEVCPLPNYAKKSLRRRKGYPKKLAKFKLSVGKVSIASILGYYHLSRYLGMANVPPAVVRSFDVETVRDFAIAGRYLVRNQPEQGGREKIQANYNRLADLLFFNPTDGKNRIPETYRNRERAFGLVPTQTEAGVDYWHVPPESKISKRKRAKFARDVLRADNRLIVGALSKNIRGEKSYKGLYGGSMDNRRRFPIYYMLTHDGDLETILESRNYTKAVQKLRRMIDLSGLLVLDYLFANPGRSGNVHRIKRYYYRGDDGATITISKKAYKKLNKADRAKLSAVLVNEMLLKDNDSGFSSNRVAKKKYVEGFRHFSPKMKAALDALLERITKTEIDVMADYFKSSLLFTESGYATFKSNLVKLTSLLAANERLRLDLDIDAYFSPNNPT